MTQRRLRVLVAETDSNETIEALHALFPEREKALEVTSVSTVATLLATIKVVEPEIILLDLSLSLREPMDAVHLVHRAAPGVPLVIVADPAQREQAVHSLTEGAMDYVLRGCLDSRTLHRVLRAALERNTLEGLTDMLRDPETELYTRDGFLTVGARRWGEAHGNGGEFVLICALFENLAEMRETFGPGAAALAIQEVAGLLKGCCRRSDVVGRLGEAQFGILGVDAVAPSAEVMRNRLQQRLAALNRSRSPQSGIELRTSIGSWSAREPKPFAEFLDSVEAQLRLARVGTKAESMPESEAVQKV